jgi:hypothetical protein
VYCCHTAILFSDFLVGQPKQKRPLKGRFFTLKK